MVTQRDIADKLGVSVALVSRVVTGTAADIGIPEDTIKRVQATARDMGYVPNPNARALRGGNTLTLGVAVTSFTDPFLGPILGELERLAGEHGLSLVIEGLSQGNEATLGAALSKHVVDALIIAGHATRFDWLTPFTQRNIPIATIGNCPEIEGVSRCWIDETEGFSLLLDHLADQGARSIGFVGSDQPLHRSRADLIRRLVGAHPTLHTEERWFATSEKRGMHAGHEASLELLSCPDRPDAILGASDLRAIGALRAAHENQLSIPADLKITGFDNLEWAKFTAPPLTTVRVPRRDIVQAAFSHVVNRTPAPALFSPSLRIRKTT